jgi:hypothetical protein
MHKQLVAIPQSELNWPDEKFTIKFSKPSVFQLTSDTNLFKHIMICDPFNNFAVLCQIAFLKKIFFTKYILCMYENVIMKTTILYN